MSREEYQITSASAWSRRYFDTFYDYHTHPHKAPNGRPFTGQREQAAQNRLPKSNRRPDDGFIGNALENCAHICDHMGNVDREASFASVWTAPYIPEMKYFVFNDQQKRCRINYQLLRADLAREEEKYYVAAGKIAAQKPSLQLYYGEMPPYEIVAELGITPPIRPQLADLFIGGNPWLLGFDDEVDEVARKLLKMDQNGRNAQGGSIYLPPPRPAVAVDEVIAAAPNDLAAMIAAAVASAMAKRDREERLMQQSRRPARGRPRKVDQPPVAV